VNRRIHSFNLFFGYSFLKIQFGRKRAPRSHPNLLSANPTWLCHDRWILPWLRYDRHEPAHHIEKLIKYLLTRYAPIPIQYARGTEPETRAPHRLQKVCPQDASRQWSQMSTIRLGFLILSASSALTSLTAFRALELFAAICSKSESSCSCR